MCCSVLTGSDNPDVTAGTSLADLLNTALIQLDERLHVIFMNQAAESLFGTSLRQSRFQPVSILGLPEALLARLAESRIDAQSFSERQISVEIPGQEAHLIDCVVTPYLTDSDSVGLILECSLIERPYRIAREEALLSQQQQQALLLRSLAHEIRNPLGGISGAAQLLASELEGSDLNEYTTIVIREAQRLQQLLDRMLGPRTTASLQPLNIHEPLEHVRSILSAESGSDVAIETDYDPSIPELVSDWNCLTQVFLNIAANAVQAIRGKGRIRFQTRITSNFTIGSTRHRLVAVIRIIDDGPGIDPAILNLVFYPMVSSRDGGTGLGLSIAQQLVHQLGGLIECDSEPGNTSFITYLPLEH